MTMNVFLMTFVRKKTPVWRYQMGRQKPKKDRQYKLFFIGIYFFISYLTIIVDY